MTAKAAPNQLKSASAPTVSTAVAEVTAARTEHLFGLMGNGNAHLISHLTRAGFPFTSARHEAATVAMADAYYRATGKIAAATTTYGAGFTNAYTALAEARLARIPLVLVVGDAPTRGLRAFDIDQAAAARAVGVAALTATSHNAAAITHHAFDLALRTLQPVILAIPYDLVTAPLTEQQGMNPLPAKRVWKAKPRDVCETVEVLLNARRPLLLAGRGVLLAGAAAPFQEVGDRLGALFMTSAMAMNVINSPWNLGIAGGFSRLNRLEVANQADVVLVAGASLNDFQTRYGTLFSPGACVVRIDNEADAAHPQVTRHVQADLLPFLEELLRRLPAWNERQHTWREAVPEVATPAFRESSPSEDPAEFGPDGRLNPRAVIAALERILPAERSIVMDGGHFMGWAPMYLSVPDPYALVLVGTAFQSVGLGLTSAPGVAVGRPDRTTVLITGDGGALMGLVDLETFLCTTSHGVLVVLNDAAYGAELHQYASKGLDDKAMLIDEVGFSALGRAMGAQGVKIRTLTELSQLEHWFSSKDRGVFVLDICISQKVVVEYMSASLAGPTKHATAAVVRDATHCTKEAN